MDATNTGTDLDPYATAAQLGLMAGSPPPPDKRVTRANWLFPPYNRWAFSHLPELIPSVPVSRGDGPVRALPDAGIDPRTIEALPMADHTGADRTVGEMLPRTWSDALVVLHRGRLVYEKYDNGMTADNPHLLASVTKSFTGTLTLLAVHDGLLDPAAATTDLLPELAGTGWDGTTLQQVMDMTVALYWDELTWLENDPDPSELDAPFLGYLRASGSWVDERHDPAHGLWDFLSTLRDDGTHGERFTYFTPATEILGWALVRAHGKPYAQILSERIWSNIGAEHDGRIGVDPIGTAIAGGGFNVTARDLARFGQLLLEHGGDVIPAPIVADLRAGGDREAFARSAEVAHMDGWSYRAQWWIPPRDVISAWGVCGQILWVDYETETVIARLASAPESVDPSRDTDEAAICETISAYLGTR